MTHKGTVTIETERLILRRHKLSDAEDMFRNWASSEKVTEFMTWQPHAGVADSRAYIQSVIDCYPGGDKYDWIIVWKETGEAIGAIGAVGIREDIASCEIGYCLSDRFWGRGVMPEAFKAVIRYLFDEVGMNRIQATHDPRNQKSGRVMEKCGLRYEGTLRQADRNNKGVCDVVMRAILKSDLTDQHE